MDASNDIDAECARIFREHGEFALRVLRRFGVRGRDLADARQDVFVVVHRRLPEFEGRAAHRTWLYRICACVAADYRKRAHRRYELLGEGAAEPAAAAGPELEAGRAELASGLERALDRLDDEKRRVFVLYELEELSMAEVADALGCPLKTAFSRLYAARRELRVELARAGYAVGPALLAWWLRPWKALALSGGTARGAGLLFGAGAKLGAAACAGSALAWVVVCSPRLHAPTAPRLLETSVAPRELPAHPTSLPRRLPSARPVALSANDSLPRLSPARRAPSAPFVEHAQPAATPPAAPTAGDAAQERASPWIRARVAERMPAPDERASRAPTVGLDEVMAATSVKPLMRFGPTRARRDWVLVPESTRAR